MKIKAVAPGWPPPKVPGPVSPPIHLQCEAVIPLGQTSYLREWHKKRYAGLKTECCTRIALYNMDGVNYCAIHAGKVTLRYLWEQSQNDQ